MGLHRASSPAGSGMLTRLRWDVDDLVTSLAFGGVREGCSKFLDVASFRRDVRFRRSSGIPRFNRGILFPVLVLTSWPFP